MIELKRTGTADFKFIPLHCTVVASCDAHAKFSENWEVEKAEIWRCACNMVIPKFNIFFFH
jgi:hypothetical protein